MDANLSDALLNQDTPTMVVEGIVTLLTLVGVGLKAAGKNVPIIDQVLTVAKLVLKVLPQKKALPPSDPEKEAGLAAVIELKDVKKADDGPPSRSEKGPQP